MQIPQYAFDIHVTLTFGSIPSRSVTISSVIKFDPQSHRRTQGYTQIIFNNFCHRPVLTRETLYVSGTLSYNLEDDFIHKFEGTIRPAYKNSIKLTGKAIITPLLFKSRLVEMSIGLSPESSCTLDRFTLTLLHTDSAIPKINAEPCSPYTDTLRCHKPMIASSPVILSSLRTFSPDIPSTPSLRKQRPNHPPFSLGASQSRHLCSRSLHSPHGLGSGGCDSGELGRTMQAASFCPKCGLKYIDISDTLCSCCQTKRPFIS
ncbi:hypothetical protein P9112_003006 [Eukaryota sp. TZLM1-RC]